MSSNIEKPTPFTLSSAEFEQLLEQRELLDATELIAQMGHCLWDYKNNRLISCSQGYARIFNMSITEIMDLQNNWEQSLAQILPEDRDQYLAAYYSQQETGNYTVEYRFTRNDGEVRWLREVGLLKFDQSGEVVDAFGIIQDITEKKHYEQSLQDAKDLLEKTVIERTQRLADTVRQLQQEIVEREMVSSELEHKNAELERFAYTVSHDLKTPLVTIKGFLGLLNKDLAEQDMDRVAMDMTKINLAADTMAQLLEELLELSRIGRVAGEPVSCGLSEIARHAMQMVEPAIVEQGIEITIDDMPAVRGDKIRLIEVYQNLIENAIKFMGDQSSPRIHIGSTQHNGKACFFVSDNGLGIEDEYHGLVFELFERLNLDAEGTGVGLTLVKRIVEVHGGEIWIESSGLGHGCTISFTLPGPL